MATIEKENFSRYVKKVDVYRVYKLEYIAAAVFLVYFIFGQHLSICFVDSWNTAVLPYFYVILFPTSIYVLVVSIALSGKRP